MPHTAAATIAITGTDEPEDGEVVFGAGELEGVVELELDDVVVEDAFAILDWSWSNFGFFVEDTVKVIEVGTTTLHK